MSFPLSICSKQCLKLKGEDHWSTQPLANGYLYTGIFDGHHGDRAALMCAQNVPCVLSAYLQKHGAVASLIKALLLMHERIPDESGCTATVLLTHGAYMVMAIVGDSRVVLFGKGNAYSLSRDHNLRNAEERSRIERAEQRLGTTLICGQRVQQLMLTRSIGDKSLTKEIVPNPDIIQYCRDGTEDFMVIASDGLWDVVDGGAILALVASQRLESAPAITEALVEYARQEYQNRKLRMDDITVTVVYMKSESQRTISSRFFQEDT